MALKILQEYDFKTNSTQTVPVPAGKYRGFLFVISGTTDTGKTVLATADLGTIQMNTTDQMTVNTKISSLVNADMRWFGAPSQITPAAGATVISSYLPASPAPGILPNVFYGRKQGALSLILTAGSAITTAANWSTTPTLYVYGDTADDLPAVWVPRINNLTETTTAGGTKVFNDSGVPGITDVFIRATSGTASNGDRITLESDAKPGQLNAAWIALWNKGNIEDATELGEVIGTADATATVPQDVHILPGDTRKISTFLTGTTTITATTAAAMTYDVLYVGGQLLGDVGFETAAMAFNSVRAQASQLSPEARTKFAKAFAVSQGWDRETAIRFARQIGGKV